jgi:hypothetical protein
MVPVAIPRGGGQDYGLLPGTTYMICIENSSPSRFEPRLEVLIPKKKPCHIVQTVTHRGKYTKRGLH